MKSTITLLLVASGGILSAWDLVNDSASNELSVSLPEMMEAGVVRPEGPPPPPPGGGEEGERPEGPPPPPPEEGEEGEQPERPRRGGGGRR